MDITKLPTQSIDAIIFDPLEAIQNAIHYGWALPGEDILSMEDLTEAKNEILDALMTANTPALDKVLAAMAAHDPDMEDTNP